MIPRQASLLIADEIFYNLTGKAILQGIYSGDLFIPNDPSPAPQLVFFFMAETDISNPYQSLKAEVTLPGAALIETNVPIQPGSQIIPTDRTRIFVRWPLLIPAPLLRPGKINAKLIHENGEIVVGTPWITLVVQQPTKVN